MNEDRAFTVREDSWERGVYKVDILTTPVFEEDMHRVLTTLEPGQYIVLTQEEFEDLT